MPKRRITRPACECFDCREVFTGDNTNGTAISRQQPPPKCLIVLGSTCLQGTGEASLNEVALQLQYPHIEAAVKSGISGVLALRTGEVTSRQSSPVQVAHRVESSCEPLDEHLTRHPGATRLFRLPPALLTCRRRAGRGAGPFGAEQPLLRPQGTYRALEGDRVVLCPWYVDTS